MAESQNQHRVVIVGAGFAGFNAARVLTDWILNATTPIETTSLSVISAESVPLDVNNPRT